MQICTSCKTYNHESAICCSECDAELKENSSSKLMLQKFISNSRVKAINVLVPRDACPVCSRLRGTYAKEETPELPAKGCSSINGCNLTYKPILNDVYP
ncbi:MAG: hypothetical protein JEZ06_20230 [Anaerolineaceae bacterium]|nr:hypothetical protein [Anaerolineaceae bacterium]